MVAGSAGNRSITLKYAKYWQRRTVLNRLWTLMFANAGERILFHNYVPSQRRHDHKKTAKQFQFTKYKRPTEAWPTPPGGLPIGTLA